MCTPFPENPGKGVHITPFYDSKFKNILIKKKQHHVPTGLPDDVEIIFLHYPTFEEAKENWNRRVERINWDIFIKNSQQNGCTAGITPNPA